MSINIFLLFISLALSALGGYGFWAGANHLLLTIGAGISFFVTLAGLLAVSLGRGSANIKVLSVVFFILLLVDHLIFGFVPFHTAPYFIITGIVLLLYATLFYFITSSLRSVTPSLS